jgi:hypothetical protein
MNITLHFAKPIAKLAGISSTILEVETYHEITSVMKNLFPSTLLAFKHIAIVDGSRIITKEQLSFPVKSNSLYVLPLISGGATGFDSLGNLNILYGSSSSISNQAVALTGLAKRITESSLFGQGQTAFDVAQRKINRADGALENVDDPTTGFGSIGSTSGIGLSVPLHFGMVRTSGAIINNYVKHLQRGGIDNIRVIDYI